MNISKLKLPKLQELCIDKDSSVRKALYDKLKGEMSFFKLPEGKLYRFLTRGLSEFDPKARQAFHEFLLSFLIKSPEEEIQIKEECKSDNPFINSIQTINLNYDFKYDGTRKKQVKMTIFDLFTKLKIHKTHYIDGFSVLPQKFMKFLFMVFDRDDVLKNVEDTYKKIIDVIVNKAKKKSVSFAHFSFIRLSIEYTKMLLQDDMEGYDCLDPLIPDLDEYAIVFEYFTKRKTAKREELEILSEWSKYALHMSYTIPSIHERIKNLFLNYISDSDPSINFYTMMIDKTLEEERGEEKDIYDIDFCNKDPRDFKNIYLRKRSINNL